MSRLARRKSATGIYHIMLRGINRQTIFESKNDKTRFLETLGRYKPISEYKIYGYCLMDNHVHLLLEESKEPISKAIKRISSSYVYWYNQKYERCGPLFQGRFRSENVENYRYFLTALRYIHQNPLKAGLSNTVYDCKWTSMNEYIQESSIVDVDFALELFSPERKKAIPLFTTFMEESNQDECLDITPVSRKNDYAVKDYLHSLGVTTASLQQMEKRERDEVISSLKELEGVSIRQLSRVTGLSKSVIQRV